MARTTSPSPQARLASLTRKLTSLADRGSRRRFLPPAATTDVALPDDARRFFTEVSAGEAPSDERVVWTLAEAVAAAGAGLAAPFPFGDADAADVIDRDRARGRGEPSPALDGGLDGALPVADLGEGLDCVVLSGEQRGLVWRWWDEGWSPLYRVRRGKAVQVDFLEWIDGVVDEALESAPPIVGPDTEAVEYFGFGLDAVPPALAGASNLKRLDLTGNVVASLPDWLGDLAALEELRLGGNPLRALPDRLRHLSRLTLLDLSGCGLESVPEWLGELGSLRTLRLFGNALARLPESLGALTALRILDLRENRLAALPERLGALARLEELALSTNALAHLPGTLGGLVGLRRLAIAHNPLRALPEAMGALGLEALDLEALPALDVDQALEIAAQMPRLTSLRLCGPLPTPTRGLERLAGLETLRLVGLGLRELPPAVLQLRRLRTLSLDQNRLETLPDALGELPELRTVVLFRNPVSATEVERVRSRWPHVAIKHSPP